VPQAQRIYSTQEEMVISVRGQNIFDRPELLDRNLGLVVEGGGGDNPDVTRGEFDGGRTTTHREPSEEPRKWSREGNEVGSDLRHSEFRFGTGWVGRIAGISTSRMTVSVILGEGKEEVVGVVGKEGRLLVSGWWRGGGKNLYCGPHGRSAFLTVTP